MRLKVWLGVLCVLFVSGGLLFASGSKESGSKAKVIELTYSSVAAPSAPHAKGQVKFAEEVARLTNGAVKIKVYQGGELYTQEAQNTAIRRGTIAMTNLGPNWFAEYAPFMNMFAMAYLFKDVKQMNEVMNGPIGKSIYERLAKQTGVRPLSTWYLGTRELNIRNIGRIPTTPQQMKGVKLRMPNSRTWLLMGKALGADPTPVSISELYLALQTGTVDGQDNPLTTDVVRKFQEVTKYVIMTHHYVNPIMPCINEKVWESLSPAYQKDFLKAAEIARAYVQNIVVTQTTTAEDTMKAAGVKFINVDENAWQAYAQKYYQSDKQFWSTVDTSLLQKIRSMPD